MEFEEFIQRLTCTVREENIHMMGFLSDGKNIVFTCTGSPDIIAQSVAAALSEHPQSMDILRRAMDIMESQDAGFTTFHNEDQYNDYLIDSHLKNKDLNNGEESL